MLDIKFIRENTDFVKASLKSKNNDSDIDNILDLDINRRKIISTVEDLKAKKNIINKDISELRKNNEDISKLVNDMKEVSIQIKEFDSELSNINKKLKSKLLYIPNLPHESVPLGKDETDNVVLREWGNKPNFNFQPKGHLELAENNKLLDFKRSVKMSGTGFPLYTNLGAKLERALINFMLDVHTNEHGYTELFPPFLVTENSPLTTGNLPKFKEDMYYVELDNMYCIPTAEVPVTNMHSNEVLSESDLTKKYAAYSACFRREAGSYGKDTKGLLRVHQFNKVELVKFTKPNDSYNELESLLNDAESILQKLNLHYRIVALSTGDLSFSAAKCYDIEVWSPFENKYLEVSSCSNFESFQSRRGNIKFKNKKTNKLEFLHTINGSGLATPRLMVSLLETYQNDDSSISIPDILKPYLHFNKIC
ncbi:MAG: serine--tRNA ligase [Candidatus Marinimicrobia bacterium]|nr:serine--tRNA ligase [Candidatus Neomarinimicrobiota bacterium]|tara:strand:- start:587 stop:1855 length:1269 start_codon:yes stop_codon:yes gene_type:complete